MKLLRIIIILFIFILLVACNISPESEIEQSLAVTAPPTVTATEPVAVVNSVTAIPSATATIAQLTATATPTPTPTSTGTSSPTEVVPTALPTNPTTPTFTPMSTSTTAPVVQTQEAAILLIPSATPYPTPLPLPKVDGATVEVVGQIGGFTSDVNIQGDYAYLSVGPRLVILDISNPTEPVFVAQTPLLENIRATAVSGKTAYLLTSAYKLYIFDISDPTTPRQLSAYNIDGVNTFLDQTWQYRGETFEMQFLTDKVYITLGDGRKTYLSIINVQNPLDPKEIMSKQLEEEIELLAVAENIMLLKHIIDYHTADIVILDTLDLPAMVEQSRIQRSKESYVRDVVIVNDIAYFTSRENGLTLIDLSDPSKPTQIGHYQSDTIPSIGKIMVQGDSVYISDILSENGTDYVFFLYAPPKSVGNLEIINVSNPASPKLVSSYQTSEQLWSWDVADDLIYLVTGDFAVLDAKNPENLDEIGTYEMLGEVLDVAIIEDTAYLAAGNQGLYTVDVSQPDIPQILSRSQQDGGHALYVMTNDNKVFLTNNWNINRFPDPDKGIHLRIFDANNPNVLVEGEPYVNDRQYFSILDLSAHNDYIYALIDDSLRMIDANGLPYLLDYGLEIPYLGRDDEVMVDGNLVYVTGGKGALQVMDITNPTMPITVSVGLVGDAPDTTAFLEHGMGTASQISVDQGYVYLNCFMSAEGEGTADGDLCIVDVTNPYSPQLINFYDMPAYLQDIFVVDSMLYVLTHDHLIFIDASDPNALTEVGSMAWNYLDINRIYADDEYVYVATGPDGLYILKLNR